MKKADLVKKIEAKDASLLQVFSEFPKDEALKLSSGGAYVLSRFTQNLLDYKQEEEFLLLEWNKGQGLFKKAAGKKLLSKYNKSLEENTQSTSIGLPFLKAFYESFPKEASSLGSLALALEKEGAYAEILSLSEKVEKDLSGYGLIDLESLAFAKASALYASSSDKGAEALTKILSLDSANGQTKNVLNFIASHPELLLKIKGEVIEIANLKVLIKEKSYAKALILAVKNKNILFSETVNPTNLSDAAKAYIYGPLPKKDATKELLAYRTKIEKSKDPLTKKRLYIANYYLGRIERDAQKYKEALPYFQASLNNAADTTDIENALWYVLDAQNRIDFKETLASIKKYAKSIKNPTMFSDIYTNIIIERLSAKDFKGLLSFYTALNGTASNKITAQLAYILGRAYETKLLSQSLEEAREFYKEAIQKDVEPFYFKFLSQARLGTEIVLATSMTDSKIDAESEKSSSLTESINFVDTFFALGLAPDAYTHMLMVLNSLDDAALRSFADKFIAHNLSQDSIRTMSRLSERAYVEFSKQDLERFYPRQFKDIIESEADKSNIPPYVMFALIRTESAFMDKVVSSAGAIGLSQLMTATGLEYAKKLKIENPDFTDAKTNVKIGTYYLSALKKSVSDDLMAAVLAYNGGIGRIKRYKAEQGSLEEELFSETIPIEETRMYGRKVLAASVIYGYLYYNRSPEQVILDFFKETQ